MKGTLRWIALVVAIAICLAFAYGAYTLANRVMTMLDLSAAVRLIEECAEIVKIRAKWGM